MTFAAATAAARCNVRRQAHLMFYYQIIQMKRMDKEW